GRIGVDFLLLYFMLKGSMHLNLIAYVFVFAAIVSILLVIYVLNVNIKKVVKNPEHFSEIQKQFMLGMAIGKVPPSLIIVFGILKMPSGVSISSLIIPWLIILIAVIFGIRHVSLKRNEEVRRDSIAARNLLVTNTRPLLVTIPLMASAFIFLMT